jgi:acyl-CoA reductase-like NAD-dependent aldehyde dehydrogenase
MSEFTMTINGVAAESVRSFDVLNPATGEVVASAPECSREQLDTAMEAAAKAFPEWKADRAARAAALSAAAAAVLAASDEFVPLITAEQGKPLSNSAQEVQITALWLNYFAGLELPREIVQDDDAALVEIVRKPMGVVAAITPWNLPICTAAWKIGPALAAGNTLVLKPSPYTPLSNLKLGEILRDLFPPGVLNIVSGGDELGEWMTTHPTPRKVAFTGSVRTGKRIAAAAAPDLKRVTLELGGNDPAVVLDDADVDSIADGLFWSSFANNGQVCAAVKRIHAPEAMYERLVDALADRAKSVSVGNGTDPGVMLGPLNNRPQLERVEELVGDALSSGGRAAAGGKAMEGPGYFFEPTIMADVSDGVRLVDEEQFGPAVPVIAYRDVDDAVERANSTHFGLGASVWTGDVERGREVAERFESGSAWINTHMAAGPQQPFGGVKWSGIGVENGPWGLMAYTDMQVVYQPKS